ncbi:hypothetical protein LOK74_21625 [Brevibacillus humidisoli]|uniref:hypothetical protein n=1 Tax=Brevibacillus humidisoli TaxID=2895522 RepID=UPI001E4D9EF3|nr:hypothetical protein [Brevibacillus humidisoli]UFJ40587.1 hypothetical protein LOK74_21625 [Brevibacillus humidisoli]
MLVENSFQLVERCHERQNGLLGKEELKQAFIDYVFTSYQEEVLSEYNIDEFYRHLDELNLSNCRRDFDSAVEQWYAAQCSNPSADASFHPVLYGLVKETIATRKPSSRDELVKELTVFLTSADGYMLRWKKGGERNTFMYYRHLHKMGIHVYQDIEALIDVWLIEYPTAFDKQQQAYFAKPTRRGRPNNLELSQLMEKAYEMKPELTPQERERVRKIFYYHRHTLSIPAMAEKVEKYVSMRATEEKSEDSRKTADSPHVG